MKLLIATFDNAEPARSLKERFERAGIQARVFNNFWLQLLVFWSRPMATHKVFVDVHEFTRARDLLDEWERNEHVLEDAVRCPECRSPRVDYPQFTRKFIMPLLIEHMITLGRANEFYCADCHFTWPPLVKVPPKTDLLGFPEPRPRTRFLKHR